jgi:hypothetical protein
MRSQVYLWILAGLALSSLFAGAVQAEIAGESDPNVRASRAASREYVAANRRGDLESLRKLWTPDGDYVDASGRVFKAQQLLQGQSAGSAPNADSGPASRERTAIHHP